MLVKVMMVDRVQRAPAYLEPVCAATTTITTIVIIIIIIIITTTTPLMSTTFIIAITVCLYSQMP